MKIDLPFSTNHPYVAYNPFLTSIDKILFAEIMFLDKDGKGCFATNEHLARGILVGRNSISKSLKRLSEFNYIRVEFLHSGKNSRKKVIINTIENLYEDFEQLDQLIIDIYDQQTGNNKRAALIEELKEKIILIKNKNNSVNEEQR